LPTEAKRVTIKVICCVNLLPENLHRLKKDSTEAPLYMAHSEGKSSAVVIALCLALLIRTL